MANPFDQFGGGGSAVAKPTETNPFDQFDKASGAANPFDAFDAPAAAHNQPASVAASKPALSPEQMWEKMSLTERAQAMRDYPSDEDQGDSEHSEHSVNRLFEEAGKLPIKIIGNVAGPVMAGAGKVTLAGFSDLEEIMLADPHENPEFTNLRAYADNPQAPLPVQQDIKEMKGTWAGTGAAVAAGAIEMVPKIGAVAGLGMMGIPAPIGNATVLGFDAEGKIDPVGMAAALGLPIVDKFGRKLASDFIIKRLNETSFLARDATATQAELAAIIAKQHPMLTREGVAKALEFGGGQLVNNLYLTALQTPGILESENPKQALVETMASNLALSLMGAPEVLSGGRSETSQSLRGGRITPRFPAGEIAATSEPPAPKSPEVKLAEENNLPATAEALKEVSSRGSQEKEIEKGVLGTAGAAEVKTAAPVPEKADSIAKQMEVTLDPASTKAVTLITPDSPMPEDLQGLVPIPVGDHGTALMNPAKTTREAVLAAAEGKDFDGTLLGMSQSAKPEPVGNTVVQTTKDGVPVLDEVVPPTPAAIAAASAAHASAVPGGETTVKPAEEVIAQRLQSTVPPLEGWKPGEAQQNIAALRPLFDEAGYDAKLVGSTADAARGSAKDTDIAVTPKPGNPHQIGKVVSAMAKKSIAWWKDDDDLFSFVLPDRRKVEVWFNGWKDVIDEHEGPPPSRDWTFDLPSNGVARRGGISGEAEPAKVTNKGRETVAKPTLSNQNKPSPAGEVGVAEVPQAKERAAALEAELKAEGEAKPAPETKLTEQSTNESPEEGSTDLSSGALGEVGMGGAKPGEVPRPGIAELIPPRPSTRPGESAGEPEPGSAAGIIQGVRGLFTRGNAGRFKEAVAGALETMAGRTFPKMTRLSQPVGEAAARYVSSKTAAPYIAKLFSRDVLTGLDIEPVTFGAALSEDNLRSVKRANLERASEATDPEVAEQFREMAANTFTFVGEGKPFPTEEDYQNYLRQTNVQEAIQRHISNWNAVIEPMYREAMRLDADVELPPRGEQTGARVNLAAIREGEPLPPGAVQGATRGGLLNTMRRKSQFGVRAKGTGEAYAANYEDLIANSISKQIEIANKNTLDDLLVEKGLAQVHRPGWDGKIKGERPVAFPLSRGLRKVRTAEGETIVAPNAANLYVDPRIAREYRNAANVDDNPYSDFRAVQVANLFNRAALAGLTDATVHLTNLTTALAQLPATKLGLIADSLLAAAGRADIPVALMRAVVKGSPDVIRGSKLLQKILPDTVLHAVEDAFWKNQTQLASLAEIGATKAHHAAAGLPGLRQMSDVIQWYDRTVRMVLDDAYQDLAARGIVENSETARREFVNQVGQYNRRAQGALVRLSRDLGTGPFVTAGRAFNVLGVRGATLNPGVEATSIPNAAYLRANAAARWMGVFALVALINYLINGKPGGREGTPIGSIDEGTNDEQGRMKSFSVINLTGQGRALRVTGARGLIEAKQKGLPNKVAADAAVRDVANAWIAPFAGPMVKFGFTAASGFPPAINVGRSSKVVPPGQSQAYENLWQAIKDANPVVAGIDKATEPGKSWEELVKTQLPRFTMQTKQTEKMIADYPVIVRRAQANAFVEDVIRRARYIEQEEDRRKFIRDSLQQLNPQDRQHAEVTLRFRKIKY